VHCQGRAVWSSGASPARIDLEQLRAQMRGGRLEPSSIYPLFARLGLKYGPAHQGITAIDVGENQLLAKLRLPAIVETDYREFVLHPSLMDSALQASIGLIIGSGHFPSKPFLPFALELIRIVSACTREMTAWVRYSPGTKAEDRIIKLDIDLCDQHGNVCMQIRGFSSRILENEEKSTNQKPANNTSLYRPTLIEDSSDFDSAFYQELIANIMNHEISIDEAVALE